MSTVRMVECDNPQCHSVGTPEWTRSPGERRTKGGWGSGVSPPYGWLWLSGGWMGSGPFFEEVMVCSIDCAKPALEHLRELDRER